jgi:hypothetical protein
MILKQIITKLNRLKESGIQIDFVSVNQNTVKVMLKEIDLCLIEANIRSFTILNTNFKTDTSLLDQEVVFHFKDKIILN